jgi:hypothetical protein
MIVMTQTHRSILAKKKCVATGWTTIAMGKLMKSFAVPQASTPPMDCYVEEHGPLTTAVQMRAVLSPQQRGMFSA